MNLQKISYLMGAFIYSLCWLFYKCLTLTFCITKIDNFRHSGYPKYPFFDVLKILKVCFPVKFYVAVSFPGSKVTFEQFYFSTNQQPAKFWIFFFENYKKWTFRKFPSLWQRFIIYYIEFSYKCKIPWCCLHHQIIKSRLAPPVIIWTL